MGCVNTTHPWHTAGGVLKRVFRHFGKLICRVALCLAAGIGPAAAHAPANAYAKLGDAIFTSILPDVGMPNGLIQAITQDGDGFLWFGTQGGLNRWDGTHMRVYMASASPGSIPGNVVLGLHRDTHGHIWLGTDSSGLAYYDRTTDQFIPFPLGATRGSRFVVSIIDDRQGGLWLGTGDGVWHLDSATVAAPLARQAPGAISHLGLAGYQVESLLLDHTGLLWVGTNAGLIKMNIATGEHALVHLPVDTPSNEIAVLSILEDADGAVWIGTEHEGVFIVGPDRGAVMPASTPLDHNGLPFAYGVYAMGEVSPGTIWVGTDGRGILELRRGSSVVRTLRHDPSMKTSLITDTVRAFYKDRSGHIWLGTDNGFSIFDTRQRGVVTMFGSPDRPTGLPDPDITSITSMPNGKLWVGLRYHGIDILDPAAGTVQPLWPDSQHLDRALPPFAIVQMATLPDGTVLAATVSGLYRLTDDGRRIERLTVPGTPATATILSVCYCHGSVWLGEKTGLWQVEIGRDGPVRLRRAVDGSRLTDQRVQTIYPGDGDEIWVGTVNGVDLVHANSDEIERIAPNRGDKTQMASGEVMTFVRDHQHRLWIGTMDDGAYLMEGTPGHRSFRHFSKAEGLPNDDINALQLDAAGHIWMSTDQGLASIDPQSFAVHVLRAPQGVAITTYWNGSSASDQQGNLFFGGLGGLTIVDPTLIEPADAVPALAVTDVHLGSRTDWVGRPDASGAIAPIVLTPQENSLTVQFTLLDYDAPARDNFAYRLEGFDPDWVQSETAPRNATYTNVPPGQYVLKLRGADQTGRWLPDTLALPVVVLPNWYQTPWFRLATLVCGALFIAILVQIRTALLRQRQRELERVVAERTAELSLTQAQLRHFAYVDMLTGLPNRRAFTEEFRRLLEDAQPRRARVALLLIDMDGFKQVNDTLGHHAGDALLVAVGGRLRGAVREGDFVARLGGDEFAVLLVLEDDAVELVCHRIIDSFGPPVAIDGDNIVAGASIGVAIYPDHGLTQERIYKMADVAMYAAKREGRGTWRCFADAMEMA